MRSIGAPCGLHVDHLWGGAYRPWPDTSGFECWICLSVAAWLLANCFISLSLCLLRVVIDLTGYC